jgi:hypothetical protein
VILGTACEPDDYRCNGVTLERCADDRSGFVFVQTCASAAECNLNAKACRPCMAGEFMCRDASLERCDNGLWQEQLPCPSAASCSVEPNLLSGNCNPPECEVIGAHACDGATLLRCPETQDHWQPVELCENGDLCDAAHADALAAAGLPARCLSAECAAGAFRCEEGLLQVCAPDRKSWLDKGPCGSADLCSATRGTCGACEPGEIECNGAELRSCTEAGVWETLDACESAALCDAEEGECREAECSEPGTLRCNRVMLERCSVDLLWEEFEACASEQLCSVAAGRCLAPACALDERRCRNGQHQRCSAARTHWTVAATCGGGERCDVTDGCVATTCTADMQRCNGSSLERCVGGRFEVVQSCATESLCDVAAGCAAPECGPGPEFQCSGTITRRCRPGRDGFEEFFTCPTSTTCDAPPGAGRYECDACTPDDYACTPEGTALLRCSSDGQVWERVQSCPGGCMLADNASPMCN